MRPEPNEPWEGIRNATESNDCTSIYTSGFIGSEDCLTLKVSTPITNFGENVEAKLPVMVSDFTQQIKGALKRSL